MVFSDTAVSSLTIHTVRRGVVLEGLGAGRAGGQNHFPARRVEVVGVGPPPRRRAARVLASLDFDLGA